MDEAIKVAEERTERAALSEEEMRYYEALENAPRNMISSHNYHRAQGFKEGEEKEGARFAALMDHLLQDNRMEDLQKIAKYPDLRKIYFKEYKL